jgi:hypothetical protein
VADTATDAVLNIGAANASRLQLLLPAIERLRGGLQAAPALARLLARGNPESSEPGREAQLLRHFDVLPRRIPVAALTRALDADDAGLGAWLRADPAWLRADMASGRMMACGDLQLTAEDADALLRPLRPLFGDEGFPISAPVPHRWYLSMPRDAQVPVFSTPQQALGDDLHVHMPAGDAGRRWRRLMNEAQVILHNHPVNAARVARGQPPVNSLWFWGWGVLPDQVVAQARACYSDDDVVAALCKAATIECSPLKSLMDAPDARGTLVDLRRINDIAHVETPWLPWALQQLHSGGVESLVFDFDDGRRLVYRHAHRWRFWRRTPSRIA